MGDVEGYPMVRGIVHAGEFVFVRSGDALDDHGLFELFGLEQGLEQPLDQCMDQQAALIARNGQWAHFCDNCWYTLFNLPDHGSRLVRAAARFDLFSFVRGDVDESFEFRFYRSGECVRLLIVDSPNYSDRVVRRNEGAPLPGESPDMLKMHDVQILKSLAAAQGITVSLPRSAFRCYAYTVHGMAE